MCNLEKGRSAGDAVAPPVVGKAAERGSGPAAKPAPRSHWLEALIYPEERDECEHRADQKGLRWVSILHDLDTKEGGELKKEHVHFLAHFENARTVTAFAKDLGISAERVIPKDNGSGALAYLTHNTDKARLDGKHEYPIETLRGPLAQEAADAARKAKGQADEGRQVCDILDWVDAQEGIISMRSMARWAASEGRWAVYRRAGVIFKTIVEEHNNEVYLRRAERHEANRKQEIFEALTPQKGPDKDAFKKLKARAMLVELGLAEEGAQEWQ